MGELTLSHKGLDLSCSNSFNGTDPQPGAMLDTIRARPLHRNRASSPRDRDAVDLERAFGVSHPRSHSGRTRVARQRGDTELQLRGREVLRRP